MTKPASGSAPAASAIGVRSRLADVALVRVVTAGGSEREIARDLQFLAEPGLPARLWRIRVAQCLAALVIRDLAVAEAGDFRATPLGLRQAAEFLGAAGPVEGTWGAVRDGALVAKALGLDRASATRRKAAARLDGLRGLIVEAAWGIGGTGRPSASRIRGRLAVIALERAFGDQVGSGLRGKTAMSAKASRLLACQLAQKPRQHATDARLVAQLAAEAVGVTRSDLAHLRQAVLRRFLAEDARTDAAPRAQHAPQRSPVPTPEPARPAAPAPSHVRLVSPAPAAEAQQGANVRPDPAAFARAVKAAAEATAEGWAGNRKAFVSRVWAVVRERHAGWGLSEIEFKGMLAEAHRMGLVTLANADLKDRRALGEIEASAVSYKNAVWHYVRLED